MSFAMPPAAPCAPTAALAADAPTRQRMLLVALDLFGRHGFDATTTRMLTQAAGVNLGAIPYHFGSKEALYAEAAEHLARFIAQQQEPALSRLQDAAARTLLAGDVPSSWVQFFLRAHNEQGEHGQAFERIFAEVLEPAHVEVCRIVSRICDRPAHAFEVRALACLAFHQVMGLGLSDTVLLRRMGWTALTPERVEALLSLIAHSLRAQLAAPLPAHPVSPDLLPHTT
ncbi:MAG: CerR family C-terminal domain-containing protein [Proteobacteria bacterium]|uniref:CerR family C-terminal domain-containing protein n=1 Tax=Aquabacterium sp. TaxID=1872578 RepID=UPI0035C665C0|nr:CerR family C-terminal domain-containing protein [Pseudomonadota bacterium]